MRPQAEAGAGNGSTRECRSPVKWAFICQPGHGGQCEIWSSLIVMEEPDWWVIAVCLQSACGLQVAVFS